ncbi:hypothetical protein ABFS82_02G047900 [Erythranthe guttata]|uniref:MADS-box domain-containing protein n=1 Tax=Erythranthe guttata TaxID=4155 RepID=A0A022RBA8_ERYGU|nr:PREDICTED: agamous-like MADS-box protein AGL62 [Erythranthe guttata]EYU37536.1 hypothetical protein MIMGU_mgv1a022314mg [Erythranthe guttata]|eukprot:XP_012836772.1 PREDICTED: agamous-like MADS-box protein AGL62 [Erythranthe guttata]
MAKKPSMGRQKIKIEKIEVKNHLQVTFSKRRSGLFKKASELCTLCGVEIAIIVFSPAGKVFSFGHPNVESIVDRFLPRNSACPNNNNNGPYHLIEAQRNASVRDLNLQLGQVSYELDLERKRAENLDNVRKTNETQYWWEGPVEKLGLDELEQLKTAMEDLKENVSQHVNKMMMNTIHSNSIFNMSNNKGVFEQYESKPSQLAIHVAENNNNNNNVNNDHANAGFGYCHGFF